MNKQKNTNTALLSQPNIYTTKIWSSFTVMIVASNYCLLSQLIESMLIPTEINILKAPVDSQFITFLMQNTTADIVLFDDELYENVLLDYRSLIQQFIPNIPIMGILKCNQRVDFSYKKFQIQKHLKMNYLQYYQNI